MGEMEDYWNEQHAVQNIAMLSNYSFAQVGSFLQVKNLVGPGVKVLDIGVGTGKEIKDMAKLGAEVYGLDISIESYEAIMDIVEDFWLFEDIEQLPEGKFDVIVCQLVVQHTSDETLKRLLKYAIRSLTMNGVFAIQYSTHLDHHHVTNESLIKQKAGGVCRKKEHMKRLIEGSGGLTTYNCKSINYPTANSQWNAYHIVRSP